MKKQNRIPISSAWRLIAGLVLFGVLAITILWETERRSAAQNAFQDRAAILTRILSEAGYGGAIHNFKNYLLRGETSHYNAGQANIRSIQKLIAQYEALKPAREELDALKELKKVFQSYAKNLPLAQQAKQAGQSIAEIDKQVRIDDTEAMRSILTLHQTLQAKELEAELSSGHFVLWVFAVFFFSAMGVSMLFYRELKNVIYWKWRFSTANEELLGFASRASHDLKSPLTSIKNLASFMNQDLAAKKYDELPDNVQRIIQHATKLEKLVTDFITLAKTEHLSTHVESVNIHHLVDEVCQIYSHLLTAKTVQVIRDIELSREHFVSKVRLHRIIVNLVGNGIKYSNPSIDNREVRITIKDSASSLFIEIADNGVGISVANKEDIYDLFSRHRIDFATGSGLGLYMVRKYVKILDGSIDYETSTSGTVFRLEIPTGDGP